MICPICCMEYAAGLGEDEKAHAAFHDQVVNGVRARPLSTERVIWQERNRRITIVDAHSPRAQKLRAQKLASGAGMGIPSVGGLYHADESMEVRGTNILLHHVGHRAVGIMMLQPRTTVWRHVWRDDQGTEFQACPDITQMWSIIFVAVSMNRRRSGIGRELYQSALSLFALSPDQIGWCSPFTDAGIAFLRAVCPDHFYQAE